MPGEIRFRITLNAKLLKGLLAAGFLAVLSLPLLSENLTMTTYYPAPAGIYKNMTTTGQTVLARDGGSVGVGTAAASPSAALDVNSAAKGFLPPRMTTAQRDAIASPVEGLTVYDSTTGQIEFYDGTSWKSLGGAGVQMAVYGFDGGAVQRLSRVPYTNGGRKRLVYIVQSYNLAMPALSLSVNGSTVMNCVLPVSGWPTPPSAPSMPPSAVFVYAGGCQAYALVPPGGTYEAFGSGASGYWMEIDF